jgi:hypothetical protein
LELGKKQVGQKTQDWVESVETEALLDLLPTEIQDLLGAMTQSAAYRFGLPIVSGLLQAPDLEDARPGYQKAMNDMKETLLSLKSRYNELAKMRKGTSQREPYSIGELIAQIEQDKAHLREDMDKGNSLFSVIQTQKQLGPNSCYNVFQFQNASFMLEAAKVLILPE